MLFMYASSNIMFVVNVTYHPASSSASAKGWYFSFFSPLDVGGGVSILIECEV